MPGARHTWIRALTALPASALHALAARLSADCDVVFTSLPQAGLGLLTMRDGVRHEPYNLGEFPLATCSVELLCVSGRRVAGAAQIMSDDAELARSLAVLDAVLANELSGWPQVADLVRAGVELRHVQDRRRQAVLAATTVDFALLGDREDADDKD